MSSKWKYADLPAQTRLDMLKNGNKDLFDEELARTKEVMDARREVGLDTEAQEKWIDSVGYNYNLHLAQNAGEDSGNVSRTGYANAYYTPKDRTSSGGKITANTGRTAIGIARENISNAAKNASEEIRKKYELLKEQTSQEFSEKSPLMREMFINSGASLDGGRAKKFFADMQEKLNSVYDEYDKAMNEELEKANRMYTQMADKITEYRNSGVEEISLPSIAKELIKGLEQTGKLEYPKLSALLAVQTKNENTDSLPVVNNSKNVQNGKAKTENEEEQTQNSDVYGKSEADRTSQNPAINTISMFLEALKDASVENIKNTFVDMGMTREEAAIVLKGIQEKAAQKAKTR